MHAFINANSVLIPLKEKSVHCSVFSPPYWSLRDYGTATWEGGNPKCDHSPARKNGDDSSTLGSTSRETTSHKHEGYLGDTCPKCGARRIDNQLGLEKVPDCLGWATGKPCGECFICHMVQVCREIWRVLRDDGTLWLNIGDSFNGSGGAGGDYNVGGLKDGQPKYAGRNAKGLKPKDLAMIPARLALALQADGWYLRMDNIWSKPNPMPESLRDRPTKSHEYLFLFSKCPKYYYDQDAVREPNADPERTNYIPGARTHGINPDRTDNDFAERMRAKYKNLQPDGQLPHSMHLARANGEGDPPANPSGRNKWSVWTIATRAYPGAHFATYPPALVEPCILAGTSEKGVCPDCGAPWERVVEKGYRAPVEEDVIAEMVAKGVPRQKANLYGAPFRDPKNYAEDPDKHLGWRPTCSCYDSLYSRDFPQARSARKRHQREVTGDWWERVSVRPVDKPWKVTPAIVLDPFSGSGTTLLVARSLGRDGIGLDLSMKYIQECAVQRLGLDSLKSWKEGKKAVKKSDLSDLPMFAGTLV